MGVFCRVCQWVCYNNIIQLKDHAEEVEKVQIVDDKKDGSVY